MTYVVSTSVTARKANEVQTEVKTVYVPPHDFQTDPADPLGSKFGILDRTQKDSLVLLNYIVKQAQEICPIRPVKFSLVFLWLP